VEKVTGAVVHIKLWLDKVIRLLF